MTVGGEAGCYGRCDQLEIRSPAGRPDLGQNGVPETFRLGCADSRLPVQHLTLVGRAWCTLRPERTCDMAATHAKASSTSSTPDQRTFVLDTSVLLSDPHAMLRFDEHEVIIPVVVVTELEGKRHHPELGYFARTALRMLDEFRILHGRLDAPLPVGEKGG